MRPVTMSSCDGYMLPTSSTPAWLVPSRLRVKRTAGTGGDIPRATRKGLWETTGDESASTRHFQSGHLVHPRRRYLIPSLFLISKSNCTAKETTPVFFNVTGDASLTSMSTANLWNQLERHEGLILKFVSWTHPPPLLIFPRPGKDKGKMIEIRYVRTFIWEEICESVLWAW